MKQLHKFEPLITSIQMHGHRREYFKMQTHTFKNVISKYLPKFTNVKNIYLNDSKLYPFLCDMINSDNIMKASLPYSCCDELNNVQYLTVRCWENEKCKTKLRVIQTVLTLSFNFDYFAIFPRRQIQHMINACTHVQKVIFEFVYNCAQKTRCVLSIPDTVFDIVYGYKSTMHFLLENGHCVKNITYNDCNLKDCEYIVSKLQNDVNYLSSLRNFTVCLRMLTFNCNRYPLKHMRSNIKIHIKKTLNNTETIDEDVKMKVKLFFGTDNIHFYN